MPIQDIFKDTALPEQRSEVISAMMKFMEGSEWTFLRKSETKLKMYPRSFRRWKRSALLQPTCIIALWPTARWSLCPATDEYMHAERVQLRMSSLPWMALSNTLQQKMALRMSRDFAAATMQWNRYILNVTCSV